MGEKIVLESKLLFLKVVVFLFFFTFPFYGNGSNNVGSSEFVPFSLEKIASDPNLSIDLILAMRPKIVFICAAYTWVDGCENDVEKARKINALAPENIAKAVSQINSKVVYYSSDYVFDSHTGPYDELSPTSPINVYDKTKLEGERLVREACADALVIRTTVVYGPETQGKKFELQPTIVTLLRWPWDFSKLLPLVFSIALV